MTSNPQMEKPKLKRTILVGLGGAGKLTLTHMKKYFIDSYGIIPPCVKLLSLDTDNDHIGVRSDIRRTEITLDDSEFLYMTVADPMEFINNSKSVRAWFDPMQVGAVMKGAGAVRQVGRLAFFYHINEFLGRLDNIDTQLHSVTLKRTMANASDPGTLNAKCDFELIEDDPDIYVCGSLAGGTGSGTFFDVGILLRETFPRAIIQGFFLLNWAYRQKPWAFRVPGNVYAALTELDYVQNVLYGDPNYEVHTVDYGIKSVKVEKPPYSLFHIVDGRNEYRENVHQVGGLCENVAHAIFLCLGSMGGPYRSVVDNALAYINTNAPRIWNGKYARYSSFGVSSIYYPAPELHKLLSAHCAEAISKQAAEALGSGLFSKKGGAASSTETDAGLAENLETEYGLKRPSIKNKLKSGTDDVLFQVIPDDVSDSDFPRRLNFGFDQRVDQVNTEFKKSVNKNRAALITDLTSKLSKKIDDLDQDASVSSAQLLIWVEGVSSHIKGLLRNCDIDLVSLPDELVKQKAQADNLKDLAVKARNIAFMRGPRKRASDTWAAAAVEWLNLMRREVVTHMEKELYQSLLQELEGRAARPTTSGSELAGAMIKAHGILSGLKKQEEENLAILKAKPTQVLIGNGNTVILGEDLKNIKNNFDLSLEKFLRENNIQTEDDLVKLADNKTTPEALAKMVLQYCEDKLAGIKDSTVEEAMRVIAKDRVKDRNDHGYILDQFDDCFRYSAALWSFSKSRLNQVQQPRYVKIDCWGFNNKTSAVQEFETLIGTVKNKYKTIQDSSYATTGDPYRIWLLCVAAALPVYFLTDMEENKRKYEAEMSPTYHIDSRLSMSLPDLFPSEEADNTALRVLGMAIVPGIDIIHDQKLEKGQGHFFTCEVDEVVRNNGDEIKQWRLFSAMYDEIIQDATLRGILTKALKEKVESLSPTELKENIAKHCNVLQEKMNKRDFTKLFSARLTYREVNELRKFIEPKGYNLSLKRYLEGK